MEMYNKYNHHDNFIAAVRTARDLGMEYIRDVYDTRIKGNIFLAKDAEGNEQIVTTNVNSDSFANGRFKWTKPWQGLAMTEDLFLRNRPIDMFAQLDGQDRLIAFAQKENFTSKQKLGGIMSRVAKEFFVMDTLTRKLWHVDVIHGIYEEI